jgi:lytic murein transglycosylase
VKLDCFASHATTSRRRACARAAAGLLLALLALPALAEAPCRNTGDFSRWLADFRKEAAAEGLSPRALAVLDGMTLDTSVLARDRAQGIFSTPFLQFSDRLISNNRLQKGRDLLAQHRHTLDRIEADFGVPAGVIVAFWGLETDFGAIMGDFPTLRALATLAYDCRRPEKFRPQLMAALRLVDGGDLAPSQMKGAWAGEMGQTQFMPKDYLESAVDYDGDGRRDLFNSVADALGSSGNLLMKMGWRRGEPWLEEVRVPQTLDWKDADLAVKHPRSHWAAAGVTMADGSPLRADELPASLHLPMGRFGPAFLAYPNFDIYLVWNQSLVYTTTAAYFATRLEGAAPVRRGNAPDPLPPEQMKELQRLLAARGRYDGEIDGRLGSGTRAGVKATQIELGLPADSWPSAEVLARLKGG